MEIKGYTLHGDYYLADKVITDTNWEEACKMKEVITLPNGKTVIAHILSNKELERVPREERVMGDYWYWTSTPRDSDDVWTVNYDGGFSSYDFNLSIDNGGARLGFHKNEIKQLLDIE